MRYILFCLLFRFREKNRHKKSFCITFLHKEHLSGHIKHTFVVAQALVCIDSIITEEVYSLWHYKRHIHPCLQQHPRSIYVSTQGMCVSAYNYVYVMQQKCNMMLISSISHLTLPTDVNLIAWCYFFRGTRHLPHAARERLLIVDFNLRYASSL